MGQKNKFKKEKKRVEEEEKNSQPVLTTLVSTGIGKKEKGTPIGAPSIQIGALVGAGSLCPCHTICTDQVSNQPHKLCGIVNQQQPAHHPLEPHYDSVMNRTPLKQY